MSGKDKARTFTFTLKPTIRLDDQDWDFRVPGLPGPEQLNREGLVKKIILRTDLKEWKHEMLLKVERVEPNRATKTDPLDRFVLVSFADFRSFRQQLPSAGRAAESDARPLQPATPRECTDYMIRLLRSGVSLQGVGYHFYGHSNSQLKSRSCFLYAASKEDISKKVEALGDFSKMKTVGKKAKRIGLLFSVAQVATTVSPDRCEDIPDIETPDYVFTDGCGLIAPVLARELARRVRIIFRDQRYTPSVFQIRYRGYKGVVTVDPRMAKEKKTLLKLRKSMRKFNGGEDHSFAVVDYSKPYAYGFLNDEAIVLLDALGIARPVLLRKQEEHFQLLADARTDFRAAFRLLSYVNRPDLAEKLLMDGVESLRPQINKLINAEHGKMLNKRDEQRCRIFVQQSRLLFGVCDAWNVLKEGECTVKVTMEGDGQPYALKGTEVSVIRNPCLHPGDWQKFRVVEKPELAHLVDCIVFSTRGRRPAADMMSGGDLDGDQFFVCWDKDLIPSRLSRPALYPGGRDPLRFNPITDDDRLVYFAKYTNASLGQVKNLYLDWARACGPMSPQCQELNRLFSQCVVGNRIKIPEKLKAVPVAAPDAAAPPFVLDELHDKARELIQNSDSSQKDWDGYALDDMLDLLAARDDIAMTEFEFIQLAFRWCRRNAVAFEGLLHLFDFNVLSVEERSWVLEQLPPMSAQTPSLVLNGLCSSSLLSESELNQFQLNHPGMRWKCVYDSSRGDRLATFLDAAATNLELFQRKLIVFRPDERLTLAIYVPLKIERSKECLVDDAARLFAVPHSQGRERQSRLALPTKMTYRLYCDERVFQLFENQRANSWVYIARPGSDDSDYRNTLDAGDRRRQRQATIDRGINFDVRASIALDKFSKGLQTHIGRVNRAEVSAAEIYIISNRDVKSMQTLDLWLEYIQTGERLPLFQQDPKEYAIAKPEDILSSLSPRYLVEIVEHQNVAALGDLQSVDEFLTVFDLLLETDKKGFLLKCFDHFLGDMHLHLLPAEGLRRSVLQAMIDFVRKAPFLAISFGRQRENLPEDLVTMIEVSAEQILRGFILSANEAENLVVQPFRSMLAKVPSGTMSLHSFAGLVELISLTVRSPEVALDILLECLEPESIRVLPPGQPEEVVRHFVRNMIAISLDHIGEASEQGDKKKREDQLLDLELVTEKEEEDGCPIVEISFRIDAPGGTPENSSHVRLTAATLPTNVLVGKRYSIDALVTRSEQGLARLRCLHPLPPYFQKCSWNLENCGPFVTTKTTFDAVLTLATQLQLCCQVAEPILGVPMTTSLDAEELDEWHALEKLNSSQNAAIEAALTSRLTCLWGPPGTGKTETIVEMICALQELYPKDTKILVTAPTHNAVDNVMRRYISRLQGRPLRMDKRPSPLRVSTDVRKVAEDLRRYTCDAMAGQEIYSDHRAMNQARKRIKDCGIIFTTCIGAGLGLLRSLTFDIVFVDEASQQTEPASLVPLVKECTKAILVGDHIQLRPTVQQLSLLVDFDVSLFERLFTGPEGSGSRLMLDTQYRMHPSVCEFSSKEFYDGKLKTGITRDARPLVPSKFPWPPVGAEGEVQRTIFVECSSKEMPGQKSKENVGQGRLCAHVCKLLLTSPAEKGDEGGMQAQTIAVLTPYTRQAELLKQLLAGLPSGSVEVSSIDGFQGREADIVVFVSVRCNEHREIGFLKDLRRMNVAVTRARAGLIVIGNRSTLTEGTSDPESTAMWKRLLECLTPVKIEPPQP
ncbi:RNA dependent RNA polymerase-domain-containing protein [Diplogelasinospora grovesii]|uniref:RNA dependent RNA polymerase-domain-containing protein n=1 Tax=Diplogelasinospora grovesii TaxID=303347 RepID=A0AAN6N342_9PEZI|nr:RNA dependent RNA polymerase-domain-containing protein [Diplogelasinospora grovesii]